MVFQPRENAEPIPGYVLLERLGAGGYGEVWKVMVPGGLTKAIKFVYGRMDDERAARELKALGRIRDVRHPFLLSLERFDLVDGQLIVVTELADMSLMDRFRACRDTGAQGIPRDELLGYLHDAADALDYMSDKYGLGHLDIKPENLLLVGGRVKVADFGLVKDLQDAKATAIGGVTPLYATPEAFDGRASRTSDQYSLAIVYQEMLTGVLPFPGGTTAQLANQHLHSPPILSPLPVHDRPAIARALSKHPDARFASCREMIDQLHTAAAGMAACADEPAECSDGADTAGVRRATDERTVSLRSTPCGSDDETHRCAPSQWEATVEPPVVDLGPLTCDSHAPDDQPGLRPTLFVGIGGMAALAMRRLRQRLHDRFGGMEAVPTTRLLLLDTDPLALAAAQEGDGGEALAAGETMLLPLRKPAEYREASDQILGWLSRRWLYNIPRSLRTEGLRPLGRLAYIDHVRQTNQRIREALTAITSEGARCAVMENTGLKLREAAPRVFIVSSISGGTGSGMLLDVAYAARELLGEMGYDGDNVCGLMVHATMARGTGNDLRKANAYATLTELNHFNSRGGDFKAGPMAILPAGELSQRPFGDCYLVHLGDALSQAELDQASDTVAQYLYLDTATACGAVLDRCRAESRERAAERHGAPRLRTFGLSVIGCNKHAAASDGADALCRALVQSWHGSSDAKGSPRLCAPGPEVDAARLTERLNQAAEAALGGSAETLLVRLSAELRLSGAQERQGAAGRELLGRLDELLGGPPAAQGTLKADDGMLCSALQAAAGALGAELAAEAARSIALLVEQPGQRLRAGVAAAGAWGEHLRGCRHTAEEEVRGIQRELPALRTALCQPAGGQGLGGWLSSLGGNRSQAQADGRWIEYCRKRLRAITLGHLSTLLQSTASSLSATTEQLVLLKKRLEQLAGRFADVPEKNFSEPGRKHPDAKGQSALAPQLASPEFVMQFDLEFQRGVLEADGGLFKLALADDARWDELHSRLVASARSASLEAMLQVDAARGLLESQTSQGQLAGKLGSCVQEALPRLLKLGGAERVLAVLPAGMFGKTLAETIARAVPAVSLAMFDAGSDVVLCHEAEELPLVKVATALIESRADYAAAARRVLTRVDVPWSSLPMAMDRAADAAVV